MQTPEQPGDIEHELLKQIATQRATNQRALASHLGVSVGKINYCLKALIDRGWVKVNNFRRADNKWAYSYLLTPSGALAKVRLAKTFLSRKELEFELLQAEISALRRELDDEASADNHNIPRSKETAQ